MGDCGKMDICEGWDLEDEVVKLSYCWRFSFFWLSNGVSNVVVSIGFSFCFANLFFVAWFHCPFCMKKNANGF